MPGQVVPSTDKICQEDFLRAFFQSTLRKSIKIGKKSILKQLWGFPKLFVLKRPMNNEQLLS